MLASRFIDIGDLVWKEIQNESDSSDWQMVLTFTTIAIGGVSASAPELFVRLQIILII